MKKQTSFAVLATLLIASACNNAHDEPASAASVDTPPISNAVSVPVSSESAPPNGPPPGMMPPVDMSEIQHQFIDVSYASDSPAQVLDVFLPDGDGPFPAIILIHGGAFKMGSKEMDYAHAKVLVESGYAAISINYRLSGEAVFPAAVHDSKAAIRFIRANASNYLIDPNRIGAWGASAGGNLTAMMATSAGDDFADGQVGDHTDVSSHIAAAINWFGPINFSTMVPEGRALGFSDDYNVDLESAYIGVDAANPANLDVVMAANPTTYLDPSDPPIWTVVGTADPLIPYTQSQNFYEATKDVLGADKATFTLIDGAGHGGPAFMDPQLLEKSVQYFDQHLK